ncbi:MAG: hypothetical protein IKT55_05140 [Clostridia bacterium]|nr:hypothetical protein [Clostridia bacterium]
MAKTYKQSELVVGVTYYKNRCEAVKKCGKEYEQLFENYYKYLAALSEEAAVTGQTADVIKDLVVQVGTAKGMISAFCNDYSSAVNSFLKDIDKADDILFKNKGRKILTDKEFTNAIYVAKIELGVGGFISYLVNHVFGGMGNELADKSKRMVDRVKDLGSVTRQELRKIWTDVRTVDSDYRNRLRNIYKELKAYGDILDKLIYIMTPRSKGRADNLTKQNVDDLKKQIKELQDLQKKLMGNPEDPSVDGEDVKHFAETMDDYWDDTTKVIHSICEESIGNLFITDFEKFRETVDNAKEYFNQFSEDYVESKKNFDEKKAEFDRLLELYEKYGDKYEKYANDGDDIKTFNKLIKEIKKTSKESQDYIDIWYQLFFDMSESKEALERYKANCDLSNENVRKAIERLEELYNNEFDAYLNETFDHMKAVAKEKGIQATVKAMQEYLEKQGFIEGLIGKMGGKIVNKALSEMEIVAMYDWIESTGNTFEMAAQKLSNMSSADPGYETMVKTVQEAFEAAKKARVDFFDRMADVSSGEEKAYYEYCRETMKNTSMNDFDQVDLMSKDDYLCKNDNPFTDVITSENIFNN